MTNKEFIDTINMHSVYEAVKKPDIYIFQATIDTILVYTSSIKEINDILTREHINSCLNIIKVYIDMSNANLIEDLDSISNKYYEVLLHNLNKESERLTNILNTHNNGKN